MSSSQKKHSLWLWRGLCWGLVAAALAWTGTHVNWHTPGKTAMLPVSAAIHRSGEHIPVVLLSGSISVNTASLEELCLLPGIGPVLAESILVERQTNGSFFFPEDLLSVRGIGQKKLAGFLDLITLE